MELDCLYESGLTRVIPLLMRNTWSDNLSNMSQEQMS